MGDLETFSDVLGVMENSVDAGHGVTTGSDEKPPGRVEPCEGACGDPRAWNGKLCEMNFGVGAHGEHGFPDAEAPVFFAAGRGENPVYGFVTECGVERGRQSVEGHDQAVVLVL